MSFYSMQNDVVFSQIGSPEFVNKYVHHDFPPVASIAVALVKLNEQVADLQDKKIQLEALKEEERAYTEDLRREREYNRMSPG